MNSIIYPIMMCEQINIDNSTGGPNFGDNHIVGWYSDKDITFEAIKNNKFDVQDNCYPYAIIEKVREGIYQPASIKERWFFKYNSKLDIFEEIDEPIDFEHLCGLTIS